MLGSRQDPSLRRGGHVFALSVLALLAMCCAPVLAQAGSAGYQYSDAPPTVNGGPPSQSNLSPAGSKSTSGVGSHPGGAKSSGGKSGEGANGSKSKSNGSTGDENEAGQQGSQGSGNQKSQTAIGKKTSASPEPGSDSGGSSPLVPILIAILVLAGGSIAYVMIKRRRAGDSGPTDSSDSSDSSGSSVSPEAS